MRLFIHPRDHGIRIDKRRGDRSDESLNRVYQAYRVLHAFALPMREGFPLSSTEKDAVKAAARILRGKART